jgi:hypothetical protein
LSEELSIGRDGVRTTSGSDGVFWSAPAERSGDGALLEIFSGRIQSSVALRLPPHSKQKKRRPLFTDGALNSININVSASFESSR